MSQARLDGWYAGAKKFRHIGQDLSYCDNEVAGEAVVLLHGFPNSSWSWHEVWPLLGEKYRLIAPDLIGYGRSDKPTDYEYNVADQVDQVVRLLAHLGILRAHFICHSSSIAVCQEMLSLIALEHEPDFPCMLSLCYLNGGLYPLQVPSTMEQRLVKTLGAEVSSVVDETFLHNIMDSLAGPQKPLAPDEAAIHFGQLSLNGGMLIASQLLHYMDEREALAARWYEAMQQTDIPQFGIVGLADPVWGQPYRGTLDTALHFMNLEYIQNAGHYPMLQAAGQLCRLWVSNLARLKVSENRPEDFEQLARLASEA